jgi:Glycosyltransferase 61
MAETGFQFETAPLTISDSDAGYIEVGPLAHSAPITPSFVLGPFPEFLTQLYLADITALSVGCYHLEDAGVTSHGLLVRDNKLLVCAQLSLSEGSIAEAAQYGNICAGARFSRVLDEPLVSLAGPGHLIYGHWIVDFLPKLFLLHRIGIDPLEAKFLIPDNTPEFAFAWLELLGISESQLVLFDPYSEVVAARPLIVPTMLRTNARAHSLFRPAVEYLLSLVARKHPIKAGSGPGQKLFVSRSGAGREGRRLLNRAAIERLAAGAGFAIFRPEALSLLDQLSTFAGARQIIGEYGSGLHGSIFAPPETLVCALRSSARHPGFLQSGLCEVMGQKIAYIFGPAGEHDIVQEFAISEANFALGLRLMDLSEPTQSADPAPQLSAPQPRWRRSPRMAWRLAVSRTKRALGSRLRRPIDRFQSRFLRRRGVAGAARRSVVLNVGPRFVNPSGRAQNTGLDETNRTGRKMYVKRIDENSDHDGITYLDFFSALDRAVEPRSYFEIGTEAGVSVAQFSCPAVCVDPQFKISADIVGRKKALHLFQMTSDEFFAAGYLERVLPGGPDIAFLDGMHRFEYILRDFINTERRAHSRTLVLIHDSLPQNSRMAQRLPMAGPKEEGPRRFAWTGDVWKIVPILKRHRPELKVLFLDCPPTGLVAVSGLESGSHVLAERYYGIVEEFRELDLPTYGLLKLWQDYPMLDSRALVESPHDLTMYFAVC